MSDPAAVLEAPAAPALAPSASAPDGVAVHYATALALELSRRLYRLDGYATKLPLAALMLHLYRLGGDGIIETIKASALLECSAPMVTQLADRAEDLGLLVRKHGLPNARGRIDRRKIGLLLAPAGHHLIREALQAAAAAMPVPYALPDSE